MALGILLNRVSANYIHIMVTKLRSSGEWISVVNFQINNFLFFIFVISGVRLEADLHRLILFSGSDCVEDIDRGFWQGILLLQLPAVCSVIFLLWCLLQVFDFLFSWFDNLFVRWRLTTNSTNILFEILYLIELLEDSWYEEAVRDERHHQETYKKYGPVHTSDVSQ